MARKKAKEPEQEQDAVEAVEEEQEPEAYENEDYPDFKWLTTTEGVETWDVVFVDPAEDVLRQIAAGKTPEGQRLTRDQMMGMAARIVADGA
jgi:hypothetical protein